MAAFQSKTDKIESRIDLLKKIYKDETRDYITDGRQVICLKSYKRWGPEDLLVLKKEDPPALLFLKDACKYCRFDVLKQLMPGYYPSHGAVDIYANDIKQA